MGLLRLILCIGIIIFHSSTLLGVVGYSAVFGFYIMSGYAITLVLDGAYSDKIRIFWVNRLLRIFPAYIFATMVSLIIYYVCENEVLINGQYDKLFTAALENYSLKMLINEFTLGYMTPKNGVVAWVFNGFPTITTQAWTNSVEMFFYFTAPFVVKLYKKKKKGVLFNMSVLRGLSDSYAVIWIRFSNISLQKCIWKLFYVPDRQSDLLS